jgi:hypothetical protein
MAARYNLLRPHYLRSGWADAGTIVTEGFEIPNGWIPTLAVDPLNTDAVNAFYAAGPRDGGIYEDTNLWPGGFPIIKPVTSWYIAVISFAQYWALTGLGANLAPLPLPGVYGRGALLLETGYYLLLETGFRLQLEH